MTSEKLELESLCCPSYATGSPYLSGEKHLKISAIDFASFYVSPHSPEGIQNRCP